MTSSYIPDELQKMTIADLKSLYQRHGVNMKGLRLKKDFINAFAKNIEHFNFPSSPSDGKNPFYFSRIPVDLNVIIASDL